MTLWLFSDPHFGHENIYTFLRSDGVTRVRYEFKDATEGDEAMVERWNSLVKPSDHAYFIGDIAMRREHLAIVKRLNGKKRLVMGNHDIYDVSSYKAVGFQKIFGCKVLNNILLTHIPVHPVNMGRFLGNAHGHIHANPSPPGPYVNLSVEAINYTPVSLEDVTKRIRKLRDSL